MKLYSSIVAFVAAVILTSCSSANKNDSFYVRGNCEMCKQRIETTALSIKGVFKADWNVDSKELSVAYDSTQTNAMQIHEAVANVGHGTKLVPMNQEAHDNLHECCKVANK
ncbi:MAG: heavy-metal-associated domain-containing protein [Cytophagaceae bacterium]